MNSPRYGVTRSITTPCAGTIAVYSAPFIFTSLCCQSSRASGGVFFNPVSVHVTHRHTNTSLIACHLYYAPISKQINASNKLPNVNKIRSDNSNNIGKTLPRMIGRRVECGRINSDNSIRIATTDQHNNGVHLKHIDSRLPGRVIAHVAGSPSTAPGSNGAVTTATESQMTVSVVTMAKIMGSASTVCP